MEAQEGGAKEREQEKKTPEKSAAIRLSPKLKKVVLGDKRLSGQARPTRKATKRP